jgi:hypothetical protein
VDEDFDGTLDGQLTGTVAEVRGVSDGDGEGEAERSSRAASALSEENRALGASDESSWSESGQSSDASADPVAPFRPFEALASLPDDLAETMEALKLAILRHKVTGWVDVSPGDVLAHLDALKELALAP